MDGLEKVAGISLKRIIHAHGSMNWAQCMKCRTKYDSTSIQKHVMEGMVPYCLKQMSEKNKKSKIQLNAKRQKSEGLELNQMQEQRSQTNDIPNIHNIDEDRPVRPQRLRRLSAKASSNARIKKQRRNRSEFSPETDFHQHKEIESSTIAPEFGGTKRDKTISPNHMMEQNPQISVCGGIIKPGVTFFGEKLDDKVGKSLAADRSKVDAVIVIGTSLSVAPMSKVLEYLPPSIPRILINRNHVRVANHESNKIEKMNVNFRKGYVFDANLLGNCDDVALSLIKQMKWEKEFQELYPSCTQKQVSLGLCDGIIADDTKGRTLLFNGFTQENVCEKQLDRGKDDEDEKSQVLNEIVHCDGCSENISRKVIMKCVECFDFDFCPSCFRTKSKSHFGGRHRFQKQFC